MSNRGEQLQRDVLAVLRKHGSPLSAYDVLHELREAEPKLAPTTIYRTLTALTNKGQVHKLESLSAFVACKCGGHEDASVLLICGTCGAVEESLAPRILKELARVTNKSGFAAMRHMIEIHGRCATCGPPEASA